MVKDQYYGLRHDVWGLGILSFFLFSGRFPFDEDSDEDNKKKILETEPNWKLLERRKLDSRILGLVQGMLIKDPNKRLTIRQVMSNPLFEFMEKTEPKVYSKNFLIFRKKNQSEKLDFQNWIILGKWINYKMLF